MVVQQKAAQWFARVASTALPFRPTLDMSLLTLLEQKGVLTAAQCAHAGDIVERTGRRPLRVLQEEEVVPVERLLTVIDEESGAPRIEPNHGPLRVSHKLARWKMRANDVLLLHVPGEEDGGRDEERIGDTESCALLVVADPFDRPLLAGIAAELQRPIRLVTASLDAVRDCIDRHFFPTEALRSPQRWREDSSFAQAFTQLEKSRGPHLAAKLFVEAERTSARLARATAMGEGGYRWLRCEVTPGIQMDVPTSFLIDTVGERVRVLFGPKDLERLLSHLQSKAGTVSLDTVMEAFEVLCHPKVIGRSEDLTALAAPPSFHLHWRPPRQRGNEVSFDAWDRQRGQLRLLRVTVRPGDVRWMCLAREDAATLLH